MKRRLWRVRGLSAFALLALIALALALAAACGDDDDEAQPAAAAAPAAEPEPAPAPAAAPEPAPAAQVEPAPAAEPEPVVLKTGTLRIGSAHPMTGDFAWAGETLSNGIRVATAMINEGDARCVAAGICEPGGGFVVGDTLYTIELVERDTRSDINAAVIATAELVRDEGVKVIFGPSPHGPGLAAQEITQQAEVLHLMALSILSSPDGVLTPETARSGGDKHWLFQTEPAEAVRSTITAVGVLDLLGAEPGDLSMILATDDPSGKFLGEFYNDVLEALGQETRDVVYYPVGVTDFSPFLTRIKAQNPDVMHNWYRAVDSVLIAAQALELQVAKKGYMVFGADPGWWIENASLDYDVPVALACLNVCRAVPGGYDPARAADYYEAVNELECGSPICDPFPVVMDATLWTHDYVFMLVKSMQAAGTIDDTTAIADELEKVEYLGVLGPLSFDEYHRSAHGYDTCLVGGGEITCSHFSDEEFGPDALGVRYDETGAIVLD